MLSSFCRWTKRPLGAAARCPVWDILGYFAAILFCQPHVILFQAHDIFSLQMDQKTSGSGCKMPSLGSMQAAFLANIASLFNSHGRLVCFHYLCFCHSYCSLVCCHCCFVVVIDVLSFFMSFFVFVYVVFIIVVLVVVYLKVTLVEVGKRSLSIPLTFRQKLPKE